MRLVRYQIDDRDPRYGWVHEDRVGALVGSPFGAFQRNEADIRLSEVKLLPPVLPSKVVCVGRNYAAHAEEHQAEVPDLPLIFLKPPSSVIGPGDSIVLPPQSQHVEHEAELAVVIGRQGRWIHAEDALDYILGYMNANDVTARDLQYRDEQWTRGKGFDTFCPIGPWVNTGFDPTDVMISCYVNEELRQMGSTRDMVFSIRQLVTYVSSIMTLYPGDLILTGTPAGVGPLVPGDRVAVKIQDLGSLENPVIAERPR